MPPEHLADQTPYRLSRFCHLIPVKDTVAVYHSLLIKTIFVNHEAAELLNSFQTGVTKESFFLKAKDYADSDGLRVLIDRLVDIEMLVPVCEKEEDLLQVIRSECMVKPEITGMYVMLTDDCNFACKYCFVESQLPTTHSFSKMDPETASWAIDKFSEWSASQFVRSIIFCGGEPLLNRSAFYTALDRIDYHIEQGTLSNDLKLQLITNGSLVDEELVCVAKKHNLKVSVSIDGKPEYHNASRLSRHGKDTHEGAIRGFRMLQAGGITVGVSMTITQKHIGHLLENVQWMIDELGIKSIGFNTLMDIDRHSPVLIEYAEAVNREMIDCFEVLRKVGVYEDRLMRKVESFVEGTPYPHDCSGCGHQIVISPTRSVGVCHGYAGWRKYFVSPDSDFVPTEHPYWKEWVQRSPINLPQCFGCEAIGICGGGCPCSADIRNGSIWAVNETFCLHAKTVLRWMLAEVCT